MMINLSIVMSELSLSLSIIVLVILLSSKKESNVKFVGFIFTLGCISSGIWLILQHFSSALIVPSLGLLSDPLSNIFKFYFLVAGLFFVHVTDVERKPVIPLILTALMLGLFMYTSSISRFVSFTASTLIIVSIYFFLVATTKLTKDLITSILFVYILLLFQKSNPTIATIAIIAIAFIVSCRVKNKDVETFFVFFIFPLLMYPLIRSSIQNNLDNWIYNFLRFFGLGLIVLSAIALIWKRYQKNSFFIFAIFYIGHIIFSLGLNSKLSPQISIAFILFLPIIYNPSFNLINLLHISILPPAPSFIIKLIMFEEMLHSKALVELTIIALCSIVISSASAKTLCYYLSDLKNKKILIPAWTKITVIVLISFSLLFMNNLLILIEKAINGLAG